MRKVKKSMGSEHNACKRMLTDVMLLILNGKGVCFFPEDSRILTFYVRRLRKHVEPIKFLHLQRKQTPAMLNYCY